MKPNFIAVKRPGHHPMKNKAYVSLLPLLSVLMTWFTVPMLVAQEQSGTVKQFLDTYCLSCHGTEKQKGERRFDTLDPTAHTRDTLITLQEIIDELTLGEMPPEKSKQPSRDEIAAIISRLTATVSAGQKTLVSTGGKTVLRRLNLREYSNTLADLFGFDPNLFDPTGGFPKDQMVENLDTIGDTLRISGYQLGKYLTVADTVTSKAFRRLEAVPEKTWSFSFANGLEQGRRKKNSFLALYEGPNATTVEAGYVSLPEFSEGVPADGKYEVTVTVEALNRKHVYGNIYTSDQDELMRLALIPGDVRVGTLDHPQPFEPILAEVALRDGGPQTITMSVWLEAGWTPRFIFPNGTLSFRSVIGPTAEKMRNNNAKVPGGIPKGKLGIVEARKLIVQYGDVPQIRITAAQIRGPIDNLAAKNTSSKLFGERGYSISRTNEIMTDFARRAYRRTPNSEEISRLMAIVSHRQSQGRTALEALQDGMTAALCSPNFLYLAEPVTGSNDRQPLLTATAVANRLSYMLWSTMPDDELLNLGINGELLKPNVLIAQTKRLLAHPRAQTFIKDFLDSWLNLRALGDMPPDDKAFKEYYSDNLHDAMLTETQLFTKDLLDNNGSIINFLQADYTFVNRSLAKLYGMEKEVPPKDVERFRKIQLNNPVRGGLLGQASILTVSANGIETSPVVRGVWLLENILGIVPPPPPDNVPPIDPDVRGATSIRDLLEKHRSSPACYSCHRRFDPLGFALENFDPIGGWRTTYEKNTKIDSSGELPGGKKFTDVIGLKQILVAQKDQFARALTERLLSYGCGRRVEPLDRTQVDAIVRELANRKYGFRDLIELIVTSPLFLRK